MVRLALPQLLPDSAEIGTTRVTGWPRFVIVTGSRVFFTSSRICRHLALNALAAMTLMAFPFSALAGHRSCVASAAIDQMDRLVEFVGIACQRLRR